METDERPYGHNVTNNISKSTENTDGLLDRGGPLSQLTQGEYRSATETGGGRGRFSFLSNLIARGSALVHSATEGIKAEYRFITTGVKQTYTPLVDSDAPGFWTEHDMGCTMSAGQPDSDDEEKNQREGKGEQTQINTVPGYSSMASAAPIGLDSRLSSTRSEMPSPHERPVNHKPSAAVTEPNVPKTPAGAAEITPASSTKYNIQGSQVTHNSVSVPVHLPRLLGTHASQTSSMAENKATRPESPSRGRQVENARSQGLVVRSFAAVVTLEIITVANHMPIL